MDDDDQAPFEEGDGPWQGFWFTFVPLLMLALLLECVCIDGFLRR